MMKLPANKRLVLELCAKCIFLFIFQIVFSLSALGQIIITPGAEWVQGAGVRTVNAGDTIRVLMDLNRSYECTLMGSEDGTELGFSQSVVNPNGNPLSGVLRGDTTQQVAVDPLSDTNSDDNRISIFATVGGYYTFTIASAKAGGEVARVVCAETSIYGSFNTSVNEYNFLELTNISNSDINVIWIARDHTGFVNSRELLIPSDRRVDVDLHSAVGQGLYGSVKLKHNGPLGAIKGSISQYDLVQGSVHHRSTQTMAPRR